MDRSVFPESLGTSSLRRVRFRGIWPLSVACLAWSCGSSSGPSSSLFSATKCTAGETTACTDDTNHCTGHVTCGPDGTPGPCICDTASGSGGAFGSGGFAGTPPGSGGVPPFGGAGGSSGFPNTGGVPFGTGGVSVFDGSVASGGAGGAGSTCPAGHYAGTYSGMYGGLLSKQKVDGTIDFTVDVNGAVTGTYAGTTPNNGSKADLNGTVDCTTSALTMRVENGTYPGLLSTVHFTGTMPGTYSPESQSWTGTWQISDDNSQSGNGTWSAR